jgi:cytochrome P450
VKRLSLAEMQAFQNDQLAFTQALIHERLAQGMGGVAHCKMLWQEMFLVAEPAVIRELLIHHGDKMQRDPFVRRVFKRIMGNGVFIAEGENWRRQRKLVQPAFHAMRIRDYMETMAAYTREMVAAWRPGQEVVIDDELTRLTLRIIAKTMFDVDLETGTAVIGQLMKEILLVGEAQLKMAMPPPAWLPTPGNRRQQRALRAVKELLREIIHQRQAAGEDRGDLLSMLLAARDEEGRPMSEEQLLDECVTLFVAGHETTAAALTWSWYLLAQHPGILAQLRQETVAALAGAPLTFATLAQTPLLEAVVKETLRLYPPAFAFAREVVEPFTAAGYHFPRRAVIMFSVYATHRRPDLWPEPEAFKPERFLNRENEVDRYAYLPFGAGSRICLGNSFAMLEAQTILATMVERVNLTPIDTEPATLDTVITLRPRDPLGMRVKL